MCVSGRSPPDTRVLSARLSKLGDGVPPPLSCGSLAPPCDLPDSWEMSQP